MEFHQLRDFIAVASTGSFRQAASRCRVAQPSLSKAVQRLEVEVGEKLFIRSKRRTSLTPAGDVLFRHALRIINEVEQVKQELAETNGLRRGTVKVGVLSTISPYFLPRVLAQFVPTFPSLQMKIVEERTVELLRLIESGDIDLALVSLPANGKDLAKETLFEEELLLAVPSKHRLAVQEKIELKDLESERFILMKEGNCLADQILNLCNKSGLRLQIVLETSQIETLQSLVMAGLGISLVPQMARISGRIPLVYRSLENPKPSRNITAVWSASRKQSRAAGEFLNHVRKTAKAFVETAKN